MPEEDSKTSSQRFWEGVAEMERQSAGKYPQKPRDPASLGPLAKLRFRMKRFRSEPMSEDSFWKLLEGLEPGEKACEQLDERLAALPLHHLVDFEEQFHLQQDRAYRWDLWCCAYLIGGGCNDDRFSDFRSGLLFLGREIFENALTDADGLADALMIKFGTLDFSEFDLINEDFGCTAYRVFEERSTWDVTEFANYGSHTESPIGTDWDFENYNQTSSRLPKLTEAFGEWIKE